MMRSRAKPTRLGVLKETPALIPVTEIPSSGRAAKKFSVSDVAAPVVSEWEVRPGGMLVQKRDPDADANLKPPPPPPIRVRVKHGSVYHEIRISPDATFWELKKLLSTETGLHPLDQKVVYKDKERNSSAFLDVAGVKDRSKMVLSEDPAAQAKRVLEMMKNAKMEKAAKSIFQIGREIDRLARQVSSLEMIVSKGKKVAGKDVLSLTEQLMNLLLELDGIIADGDVKLQRGLQVKRVQKYVETLDVLKVKNTLPRESVSVPQQEEQQHEKKEYQHHQKLESPQPPVVVTTRWETFDLLSSMPPTSSANSTTTAAPTTTTTSHTPRFDWELF